MTPGGKWLAIKDTAVVLFNEIPENAALDEVDTVVQANLVAAALEELGFGTVKLQFSLDLNLVIENLRAVAPVFVFNLVESVDGEGKLSHFAPYLLEHLKIKYSGCPAEVIDITTNKLLAKKLLRLSGINTPGWVSLHEAVCFKAGSRYILKPVNEDASIGLEGGFLVAPEKLVDLRKVLTEKENETGKEYFAEEFIDGREFNISILGRGGEPDILPPAEIRFIGYQETGRIKIVDYKAKWDEDSFEYQNTQRTFKFGQNDLAMIEAMKTIAHKCWNCLRLKGYARVDLRVDQNGTPWVLEANANPCLTPGSGFMAAASEKGLSFTDVIGRIIKEI